MGKKITIEEFIERAKKKYGNTYDYSLVNYQRMHVHVKIICKKHGIFKVTPANFLSPRHFSIGCPECGKISSKKNHAHRLTINEFKKRIYKKYGNKFNLNKVVYINNSTPAKIICKKHGEFFVRPDAFFISKYGCKECGKKYQYEHKKTKFDVFLQRAKKKYNDKFDLSQINYINYQTKIKIICPVHGIFYKEPYKFIRQKHGCYKCSIDAVQKSREKQGLIIGRQNLPEQDSYYNEVMKYTERSYKKYFSNKKRGKTIHIDHIYSISAGFINKVPPEILGHCSNLRLINARYNVLKGAKCDKTLEQLFFDYDKCKKLIK